MIDNPIFYLQCVSPFCQLFLLCLICVCVCVCVKDELLFLCKSTTRSTTNMKLISNWTWLDCSQDWSGIQTCDWNVQFIIISSQFCHMWPSGLVQFETFQVRTRPWNSMWLINTVNYHFRFYIITKSLSTFLSESYLCLCLLICLVLLLHTNCIYCPSSCTLLSCWCNLV